MEKNQKNKVVNFKNYINSFFLEKLTAVPT